MLQSELKETISHGSIDFPVGIHTTTTCPYGDEVMLYYHWHNELEFFYLQKGSLSFQNGDSHTILHEGEGLFINSNHLHAARSLSTEACSFFAVVFDPSILSADITSKIYTHFIQPIIAGQLLFPSPLTPIIPWQNTVLTLLLELYQENKSRHNGYELTIQSLLLQIWNLLVQNTVNHSGEEKPLKQYKTERLKSIISFIDQKYDKSITLSTLASKLQLSEGQFCRFFKEVTTMTPFSYIKHYRIQKSCLLLKNTDKKIIEIAGLCGFDTISYYNESFLKIMQCTLSQYRNYYEMNDSSSYF